MVPFKFDSRKVSLLQSNNKLSFQSVQNTLPSLAKLLQTQTWTAYFLIYFLQLRQLYLPLVRTLEVLGADLELWASCFSPLLHVCSRPNVCDRNTHTLCWDVLQSVLDSGEVAWCLNILNTFSNAVKNHIKESKIAVQTNPLFSWVSEQLHCIWGTVDFSWMNQCLGNKGVLVDVISQITQAQLISAYCYACPFLPLTFFSVGLLS